MSMITEMIEKLRQASFEIKEFYGEENEETKLLIEAADTIQLLSEKLHASQMEHCEDAISRRQAIDEIKRWFDLIKLNPDILIDSIVTLPSVQPAVCIAKISFDDQQMKEMVDEAKCEILATQPEQKVVRCKDCKFVWKEDGYDNLWCNRLTGTFSVDRDGYCVRAKMEEGE